MSLKRRIVLASASPRRLELLRQIGLDFEVRPSRVDESGMTGNPVEVARSLALAKAEDVACGEEGGTLVIGADTIVVLEGETAPRILGKPKDRADAVSMLGDLQGKSHRVISGIAVVEAGGRREVQHEETLVWMRPMSEELRTAYVETGEPMDKAGSYAVQGLGSVLVTRIEGCYTNVVGLPLPRLAEMLSVWGVSVIGRG